MEIKQLNNYNIEFYTEENYLFFKERPIRLEFHSSHDDNKVIATSVTYSGKVENISEELALKIIDTIPDRNQDYLLFYEYPDKGFTNKCKNAKQSFQTLSDLPYVVITKLT